MPPPSASFPPFKIAVFIQYPPKESNRDITLRVMGKKTINQDSKIKNMLGFCITLMLFIYIFTYIDSTERSLNVMKNIGFLCERWIIPRTTDVSQGWAHRHLSDNSSCQWATRFPITMVTFLNHLQCQHLRSPHTCAQKQCGVESLIIVSDQYVFKCLHVHYVWVFEDMGTAGDSVIDTVCLHGLN